MDMPTVARCTAESCAYNQDQNCHALAITVGDPQHPQCDTFYSAPITGGVSSAVAHVGACKMADCEYNVNLECQAPEIQVGSQESLVECLTYQPA